MTLGESSLSDATFSDTPPLPVVTAIQLRLYTVKRVRLTFAIKPTITLSQRDDPQLSPS